MKEVVDDNTSPVIGVEYLDAEKYFIVGYGNGSIKIFDEDDGDVCRVVRAFEVGQVLISRPVGQLYMSPKCSSFLVSFSLLF